MPPSSWPGYNTYIGARYVPLIFGEWDVTLQYEPLTIVTYQGASYTSRTFVPVGIPLTDSTYWVLTGDYNSQVSQIQMDLNQLEERTDDLETRVTTLEEEADTLNPLYRFWQKLLRGDTCVLNTLGDSLTAGNGLPANQAWPARFSGLMNTLLYNNLTVNNMAVSGYSTIDIRDHLLAGDYTANNPDALSLMIGTNDRNGLNMPLDDYIANLVQIIDYCNENEIGLLLITTPPQIMQDNDRTHTIAYNKAMISLAEMKNICVCNLYDTFIHFEKEIWPTLGTTYRDRVHFSETGSYLAARTVANYIVPFVFRSSDYILPGMPCTKYTDLLAVGNPNREYFNLSDNTSLIFNYALETGEWAQAYLMAYCDNDGGSFNITVNGTQREINTYNTVAGIYPLQISTEQGANFMHNVTINYNDRTSTSTGTQLRIKGICFTKQVKVVGGLPLTDSNGTTITAATNTFRYEYLTSDLVFVTHQLFLRNGDNPSASGGLSITLPFINGLPSAFASVYNNKFAGSAIMLPNSNTITLYKYDGSDLFPQTENLTFYTSGVIRINNFKLIP